MERYLITQSLLSSWAYIFDSFEGYEDDAMEIFLSTLRREPSEPTEAMLDGIEFEGEVYKTASGFQRQAHAKWESGIQAVAAELKGAQFQVTARRELQIGDMIFVCYGILDALCAGVISDVKYKQKSFGSLDLAGNYLDSAQHPMYFYLVPEAYEFRYLVSDGTDLYKEVYRRGECRDIAEIITDFISSITSLGLLDEYKRHWLAK